MAIAYGNRSKNYKPPDYYYIHEAAEFLRMPFVELLTHPERFELMEIASVISKGKASGQKALSDRNK